MAEKKADSLEEAADAAVLKLSDKQEKDLSALVRTSWEQSSASRVQWMEDKREGLAMYWGVRAPKDFPWKNCANLHVPLTRTICDTLHSNLIGSLDLIKPVSVMAVGPEDVPKARKAEKLLNWQFSTQVDYVDLTDRLVQTMLQFGAAPVKVRYCVERRDGKKVFDGLKVEVLMPERFLVPPDALNGNVQDMDYVIHEMPMSRSDLIKRKNAGAYPDLTDEDVKKAGDAVTKAETLENTALENLRSFYSGVDAQQSTAPQRSYGTMVEWCGSFDYDDDGVDEPVMVSAIKELDFKVIRAVKLEGPRPFVLVNFSDIAGRAFGESVPDLLLRINQELNTIHNQRVDAVTVTNIPFFFFDPTAGFNPDALQLVPGMGVPVNGSPSQAVYFPSLNTSRPEMYREEENLFLYAERMLGAGSNVQGIMQTKRITATEISSIDRRAGIRFLTIFNRLRRGIRDIFRLALALDRKHMPAEIQVRVTGIELSAPLFETISSDDIEGQLDAIVNGNSIVDDQAEKQEMLQAYNMGMMNPLIARDEVAVYELTRDLFVKLGVKRVDSYLKRPVDELPKSPEEEHNLILQEEEVEPNLGENVEDHLNKHAAMINSENFKLFSRKAQLILVKHYQSTLKMKEQVERLQLVMRLQQVNSMLMQSEMTGEIPPGAVEAMGGMGPPGQPGPAASAPAPQAPAARGAPTPGGRRVPA